MEQIKKNFGFGCMRLPRNGENIDTAETCRMVDAFLDAGFNYFDTARGYLQGKSELVLRECLTSRYPRERYILTDYPQIKVVQIQFNYLDYDDPTVQSRRCYEVCRKFGKPVIVMEPVKGGNLVNLPDDARAVLDGLRGGSPASYAIRFAAGFPGMLMVLSGMSSLSQMEDNIAFMRDFRPPDERELAAVKRVQEIFHSKNLIPCTVCRYCTDGCPKHISFPDLFATMNTKQIHHDWNADYYYNVVHTAPGRRASDCVKCGRCEKVCPQHLPIRRLLDNVAKEFEKEAN